VIYLFQFNFNLNTKDIIFFDSLKAFLDITIKVIVPSFYELTYHFSESIKYIFLIFTHVFDLCNNKIGTVGTHTNLIIGHYLDR